MGGLTTSVSGARFPTNSDENLCMFIKNTEKLMYIILDYPLTKIFDGCFGSQMQVKACANDLNCDDLSLGEGFFS